MYSGSYDSVIKRWNISTGSVDKEYIGHTDLVCGIQMRREFLYSASFNNDLRVWDKELEITINAFQCKFAPRINSLDFKEVFCIYAYDEFLIVGTFGIDIISTSTGVLLDGPKGLTRKSSPLIFIENTICFTIIATTLLVYSGHGDGVIRGRDLMTLNVLQSFQGHKDNVMSLCLDEAGVLFSTGFDGSIKKWNMASRRVSFSYENRNGSVTALAATSGFLMVGTRQGLIISFDIRTAYIIKSTAHHQSSVTSLTLYDGMIYSTGRDGIVLAFRRADTSTSAALYDTESLPIASATLNMLNLIIVRGENEVIILPRTNSSDSVRSLNYALPIVSIAANDDMIFAGTKAGSIVVWSATSLQTLFYMEEHTSQVNYLLLTDSSLYSASNDKTVIKWSVEQRRKMIVFKRFSSTALGHLGPVNSLSLSGDTLFSAGSDLSTRRWNAQTGRHEDVYFGATKSVTTVFCFNGSVFAGSEDFSVLMYSPNLPLNAATRNAISTSTKTKREVRRKIVSRTNYSGSESSQTVFLVGGIVASLIIAVTAFWALFYCSSKPSIKQIEKHGSFIQELSEITTDLETVVNTVVGLSKHAAYMVANSNVATIKKLASGGGGEIFLARVMNAFLTEKTGNLVIQKIVFIKNSKSEEAFYQEVGIMIMLSPFPNFCRIIGLTEKPASMILQYYPDGSLQSWIQGNRYDRGAIAKISKEISSALIIMHSHYLAHCDIKPQNVLVEIVEGIPPCFVTDFGITQILSDKILASRDFQVTNLRGLSVPYAAPEAFSFFINREFFGADLKKFDIYSFAYVVLELLTRKMPWC
jgi:WD40 repeat protein